MAINPPSDIVLDVARAADPLKLQAAALKLTGAVDDDGANAFSDLVDGLGSSSGPRPAVISTPGLIGLQTDFGAKAQQSDASTGLSGPAMRPYREFEAFVLQSFIQSMLPQNADGIFGHGTAGEMWKAILAEQLGRQLAKGGGIGIAAKVFKAHPGAAAPSSAHNVGHGPPLAPRRPTLQVAALEPRMAEPLDIRPDADRGATARRAP
ncbi:MAG: rod-binding protein [Hyphomicrobiales bacterium]